MWNIIILQLYLKYKGLYTYLIIYILNIYIIILLNYYKL